MGKLLLILSVLMFSLNSCGQSFIEYTFQDIRMHIEIPNNYFIQDKFPKISLLDSSGKQTSDRTQLREVENDLWKGLLVVSSSDYLNTISFNLARRTTSTGNFQDYYESSKVMQEQLAKQQMTDYDTSSSILIVGNVNIHKFMTFTTRTDPIQFSGIYLAEVNGYFLIIKSDYVDKQFGERLENAIITSNFY